MLKKIVNALLLCLLVFPVGVCALSRQAGTGETELKQAGQYLHTAENMDSPCSKADKFVIGYVDIDPYPATGEMLYYFIEQLRAEGWIVYDGELPFEAADTDAKELIHFLAQQDLGPYLRFSDEVNYYISEKYDGVDYVKEDLTKHIKNGDVDLILCMGTQPGDLLINEMGVTEVPVMVSGSVDPVGAGLCDTEEYSGKANVWCHTNTDVYRNQMKYYYDSHPFQNIGMVYYDESVGSLRPYSEAAEEIGFQITAKKISPEVTDDYYDNIRRIYEELVADGIDAFLLNTDIIKDETQIAPLLSIFYEHQIPVFVQNSEYYVEDGATMLVSASNAQIQAPFLTNAFSQILHGEQPGSLNQKFVTPPYLSLNLEAADRIGFAVDTDMLLSAEKLYSDVKEK